MKDQVTSSEQSKRLEREIDEEIERVNKILHSRRSPRLNFNEQ